MNLPETITEIERLSEAADAADLDRRHFEASALFERRDELRSEALDHLIPLAGQACRALVEVAFAHSDGFTCSEANRLEALIRYVLGDDEADTFHEHHVATDEDESDEHHAEHLALLGLGEGAEA